MLGDWGAGTFTPSMAVSLVIFHIAFLSFFFFKLKCVNSFTISQLSAKGIFFPTCSSSFSENGNFKTSLKFTSIWPPLQTKIVFSFSDGLSCISVCPHCHWLQGTTEKSLTGFLTPALQVLPDIDKIPPDPSFLQVEVSKLSWSLLLLVMVQTLSDICNSVLGSLWYFHVFFVVGNPGLYPAIQVCMINAEQRGRISQFLVCLISHLSCQCIISLSMMILWKAVKCLAKVYFCSPLMHQINHFFAQGYQVGQTWISLHKSMLITSNHLDTFWKWFLGLFAPSP